MMCVVEGCERESRYRGCCTMHYQRLMKTGDVGPAQRLSRQGAANSNWRGGRAKAGERGQYVAIWAPDHPAASKASYVLEHRLVMERHLGRLLTADEIVHHLNEDPRDNRIENLEVMAQAEHVREHFTRSHCRRGHSLDDAYTGPWGRQCRTCAKDRSRRYAAKRRQAVA